MDLNDSKCLELLTEKPNKQLIFLISNAILILCVYTDFLYSEKRDKI